MSNTEVIQLVIQGGAVGLASFCLWVLYKSILDFSKVSKDFTETVRHITKNNGLAMTEFIKENAVMIGGLKGEITKLSSEHRRANDNFLNLAGILDRNTQSYAENNEVQKHTIEVLKDVQSLLVNIKNNDKSRNNEA